MKKKYEVNLNFEVEIDCSPPEIDTEDFITMTTIKSFLNTFVTHKEEMETYYKNYFIDTFLLDCDELDSIKEMFGYQNDSKELFCRVAEECNPEVRDIIHFVYKDSKLPKEMATDKEAVQQLLNNQFGRLKVLAAEFKEKVSTPDNH